MKPKSAILFLALWAVTLIAVAQWQWVDKDGRKVYSDRPPPADIPEKSILKQPGATPVVRAANPASTVAGSSATDTPPAPKVSGKDKELEEKKKQAEQAEAAKAKAEEEKFQKTRAENCRRAQQAKAAFDSGARIARTNSKGEREILDDATRASEAKRLDDVIQTECK
ncbi:MAG: DUF4124 domain-containing protein [Burkholderiaceae bacterium]|nr:DUF4124 domain-containing protein [Burkholderiaceae bacterium]